MSQCVCVCAVCVCVCDDDNAGDDDDNVCIYKGGVSPPLFSPVPRRAEREPCVHTRALIFASARRPLGRGRRGKSL